MSIQSSVNAMIGSASRAVMAVKGYQALKAKKAAQAEKITTKANARAQSPALKSPQQMAADKARKSALNAIEARKQQKRNFMEYLAKYPSSIGKIGDLPETTQKQIAKQFTKSQRKKLMDEVDKGVKHGLNK